MKLSVQDRFWSKVNKNGPLILETPCWVWSAGKHAKGYGFFSIENRDYRAHRISWEIHNGPIPPEQLVLHRCDNPSCVRPDHLFLGDYKANSQDCLSKGRNNPNPESIAGECNGKAKLVLSQVVEIKKLYATGLYSQRELARQFSISQAHVKDLINGRRWKHLE
jgi:hypothetical protein